MTNRNCCSDCGGSTYHPTESPATKKDGTVICNGCIEISDLVFCERCLQREAEHVVMHPNNHEEDVCKECHEDALRYANIMWHSIPSHSLRN